MVKLKKSVLSEAFARELLESNEEKIEIQTYIPSAFIRNQVHAAIVGQVIRDGGWTTEVAVAKYDHLLQELYRLPLGYQFQTHQFGPFDAKIKKLISSGLWQNKWFTKRGVMIIFGNNINALLSKQSNLYRSTQAAMRELSELGITKLDAGRIELLSTICHSIKETQSIRTYEIRDFMSKWSTDNRRTKADKFSLEQTQKCLDFIIKNGLHNKLLRVS